MALYTACAVTGVEVKPQVRLYAILAQEVVCGLYSDNRATGLSLRPNVLYETRH
jgi:hypothetical protein